MFSVFILVDQVYKIAIQQRFQRKSLHHPLKQKTNSIPAKKLNVLFNGILILNSSLTLGGTWRKSREGETRRIEILNGRVECPSVCSKSKMCSTDNG